MILGAIAGLVLNLAGNPDWSQVWLIDGAFRVVGQKPCRLNQGV